jgi:sugar phosphate isomerase/epimerase
VSWNLSRLSLNQVTIKQWGVREAAEGCARAGIPWIGLWRDKVAETGLEESTRIVRETGLRVSSLCRGGMFPAATQRERLARLDDNRHAVDEAAALGAEVLVLVCGAAPDRNIGAARGTVQDGVEALAPYADEAGVVLGVEPLHPAFAADRSVVCTLGEATDIVRRVGAPGVGVVVDAYHVWWDPALYQEIGRAAGSIVGFHVDDWPRGGGDPLLSRALMGDGVIELRRMREAVEAANYKGPIEVEIFNETVWEMPGEEVLEAVKRRYSEHVLAGTTAGEPV